MKQVITLCAVITGLAAAAVPGAVNTTPLTDPTRPYTIDRSGGRQALATGSYVLDSTLVSAERRVAVINGNQVIEGESVGNATVLRIRKHAVILQSPNRRITLQLFPEIVKTQP